MDTALERWEDYLKNKSQSTRYNYVLYFNKFIESLGVTAEELFQMHYEAQDAKEPWKRREVPKLVSRYMREMKEEGLGSSSAYMVDKAVKSFFRASDIDFKIWSDEKPKADHQGTNPVNDEQIRAWYYSFGSEFRLRNRALLLFLKDSGVRISDASNLDVEDYLDAEEERNEQRERFKVFVPIRTRKTGQLAHIHIGPESIAAIDKYLNGRETGPLFLARDGTRMKSQSMSNTISRISKTTKNGRLKLSGHSLRKFHRTQLERKMNADWIKVLQNKASDAYSQPNVLALLTPRYLESYDVLRIFGKEAMKERKRDQEIENLRSEMRARAQEIENLKITLESYESNVIATQAGIFSSPERTQLMSQIQGFFNSNGVFMTQTVPSPHGSPIAVFPVFTLIDMKIGEKLSEERTEQLSNLYYKVFKRTLNSDIERILVAE